MRMYKLTTQFRFAQAGADLNRLRLQVMEALDRLPQVQGTGGEAHVSNDLNFAASDRA